MSTATKKRFDLQEEMGITVARSTSHKIIEDVWIQEAGAEMLRWLSEGRNKIVLDFASVEYMSSAFFGKLINLDTKTKARGGKLVLCNLIATVYEVFVITRLDRMLCIKKTLEEALAEFGQS